MADENLDCCESEKEEKGPSGKEVAVSQDFSGLKINLNGEVSGMSLDGVSGTIEGPDGLFLINVSLEKDGDGYIISGQGNFVKEPLTGAISATIHADSSFSPDISTLETQGEASVSKEISGVQINLSGGVENGRLSNLAGTIEGAGGAYIIAASIIDNGDGYTITGTGELAAGPVQGSATAEINTDSSFNIDPSSLNISGQASVDKELNGVHINLEGVLENGRLASLAGSLEGPGGSYLIAASVVDNGDSYTITGSGELSAGPVQGSAVAEITTDSSFNIDPSSLNISGQASVDKEIGGVHLNLMGSLENGRLASLAGTVEGAGGSYVISASVVDNGDSYTITGSGELAAGPVQGSVTAEINTDSSFNIDPSSLNISGQATVDKEMGGVHLNLEGAVENGRLASLAGTIEGMGGSYVIAASVVDNGDSYTVTGTGVLAAGPIQGEVTAEITTDSSFNIDPSSLNISGQATIDKEMAGVHINLEGTLENGRLASLAGSIEGMGGAYIIAASLIDNGDGYTISGAGNFVAGPIQGTTEAQIDTDNNFSIDPSSLNISGQVMYDQELASMKVSLFGAMESNRFSEFAGTIIGPGDAFTITVSLIDNTTDYTITGEGSFTAGPVEGNILGEVTADNDFNIDPSTLNISGDVNVDTNIVGVQITMSGSLVDSRLASLMGNIIGPNNLFDLAVSVEDNGEGYTVTGSGEFTAGPAVGTLTGQIDTNDSFSPIIDTLDVGGDVNVDTELLGNHIEMAGTMDHMSLQSLVGTIEGPNGMYLLTASVEDNGEGYTITASGDFAAGPIEGTVVGQINTDQNFSPHFDTMQISGEADVDTELAGHHIMMQGVMENGRLVSLEGTVVGPNDLYTITASINDNGDGYTIIGDGTIEKDIIKGHVHGEINTDDNFNPDFDTLNFGGEVTIESDSAGQKITGSAVVKNGYLESISGQMEGPGGLYTMFAQGVREDGGYDLEAGGEFQFFKTSMDYDFPPILIPTGVPGLNIDIEIGMGFEADASAQLIAGIKTDPHFIPDISTFEIRAATILGHGSVYVDLFGGLSVNLGVASVAVGVKAKLQAILDAYMTMSADSKGFKLSGNLYGQLMGALYAAIKMKFLFFKKEFDFKIVEGMVASLEKDFGPEEFTIENLIKAFSFGFDNFSLPGKERKGKTPSLEDQQKKNEEQTNSAADEDQKAKADDEQKKKEESGGDSGDPEQPKELSQSEKEQKFQPGGGPEKEYENEKVEKKDEKQADGDDCECDDGDSAQKKSKFVTQLQSSNGSSANSNSSGSGGGLPSNLKSGVEKLSGQDMSGVNVHYNSPEPAQLNAHAYAQGNNIHVAPGQEKHLPHEAWHVAQQRQGRVKPTKQLKSKVNINDDPILEKEADIMGTKAQKIGNNEKEISQLQNNVNNSENVNQLVNLNESINGSDYNESQSIDNSETIDNDQSSETLTN